ncbi:hypothetical protein B0H15DRAFT_945325 [Mycena belliarum]|uniref:RING-type domain-containing protein n=1 Tax=Mycena belliarum TaxID=1033014 RepID=A0AAD6UHL5_9AGAR|nr:hypothetical protein B0H15DRAFT_945325 [Mycena belliae]
MAFPRAALYQTNITEFFRKRPPEAAVADVSTDEVPRVRTLPPHAGTQNAPIDVDLFNESLLIVVRDSDDENVEGAEVAAGMSSRTGQIGLDTVLFGCCICHDTFVNPVVTLCMHLYCDKCIHRNLRESFACPYCRNLITAPPLRDRLFEAELALAIETASLDLDLMSSAHIDYMDAQYPAFYDRIAPHLEPVQHYMQARSSGSRVEAMTWSAVGFTRSLVLFAEPRRIRVPVKHGVTRPLSVDDMQVDAWLECGRGSGEASIDLTENSRHVLNFPLDSGATAQNTYTVVVTSQRTSGGLVHPVNPLVTELLPVDSQAWRGNVLVFEHSVDVGRPIIGVTESSKALVVSIVSYLLSKGLVGLEDLGGQAPPSTGH